MNFNEWFERIWQTWPMDLCEDRGDKQQAYQAAKLKFISLEKEERLHKANDIGCIIRAQIKYKRDLKKSNRPGYQFNSITNYFKKHGWTEKIGSHQELILQSATELNGHKPFEKHEWKPDRDKGNEQLKSIKQILK